VGGLRILTHDRLVGRLTLCFWAVVLVSAGDDLVLPFLAARDLDAGPLAVGVLLAGASVGLVIGLALMAWWGRHLAARSAILFGFGLVGAGNLATAGAPVVAAAVAAQIVRGAGVAVFEPSVRTLLQRSVPRPVLGRVFANVYGGVNLCAAASYAIAGPLLDTTSPRVVFVLIGGGGLAVTAAAALLIPSGVPSRARPQGV
jgi:MFS family permease